MFRSEQQLQLKYKVGMTIEYIISPITSIDFIKYYGGRTASVNIERNTDRNILFLFLLLYG